MHKLKWMTVALLSNLTALPAHADEWVEAVRQATWFTDQSRTFAQVLEQNPYCGNIFWDHYRSDDGKDVLVFHCELNSEMLNPYAKTFMFESNKLGELLGGSFQTEFVIGSDSTIHPYATRMTLEHDGAELTFWGRGPSSQALDVYHALAGDLADPIHLATELRFLPDRTVMYYD